MAERTVLVTGCSSGFGLGIANALAQDGWRVVAGLRDASSRPAALRAHETLQLDLADQAQIAAAAAHFATLDCLVNNAGYALNGPFAACSAAQIQQQVAVNFLGPALLTQALLPALMRTGGRIINMSSLSGTIGMPMNSFYAASKHALEGWAESLHHELAPHGVQVALVAPGGYRTQFAQNIRWGEQPLNADGIDARQLAGYRAMQRRMLSQPGNDPNDVVDAVLRLANAERMPLRTRVGRDARLVHMLGRLLPGSWSLGLMGRIFRKRLARDSP
jgi:NAD(P)-dependent dehydrogenase (short-subunit alcohol dehydrogenase family)